MFQDGTLSYALAPEKESRGIIDVPHASVSSDIRHGMCILREYSHRHHPRRQWLERLPYVYPGLPQDFKMLSDTDFDTWRNKMRKFLHVGSGQDASVSDLKPAVHSIDRADDIVRSSIQTLTNVQAAQRIPEVGAVITALQELETEHAQIRQTLSRRGDGSVSRSSTPASAAGVGAGAAAGVAGGAGAGLLASSATSQSGADDGDFYDAYDDFDGVEYQIEEDTGRAGEENDDDDQDEGGEDDSDNEEGNAPAVAAVPTGASQGKAVTYRKELPAPVSGEEVSLFSMLKKNVGKDLSTISFPVTFNCPLSLLQAAAEEYEYAPDLLERAATAKDSIDRISLVGAFAVSGYASTAHRSSRKPFNPLLGETFECVRTDRDLFFVAEKVVHRPPIVAAYAQGKGWKATSCGTVKNKFWGKSLELISEGCNIVELDSGDVYSISKPSSFMRNLLAGNKYLEHVGEMTVVNLKTNERLVIQFKESSMFGGPASRNHITGTVYDANNSETASIKGKWDEQVARQVGKDHLQVLWEANSMPPNPDKYYGFTYFALSLNEITPDIKNVLPPTDSRLRPDQRALENGEVDDAEALKHTLENEQRERRKQLEESGQSYKPQWFRPNSKSGPDEPEFVYGGPDGKEYHQERQKVEQQQENWNVDGAKIFEVNQ